MAITIQDGFSVRTTVPVDARFVADTVVSMNAMEAEVRYEGLTCYVVENGVLYHLKGGILNANWLPVGEGNVSGPTGPVLGNSVPVFNGTSGKELKSTPVNIDAYGGITGVSEISAASALLGSLRIAEIVNSGSSGENVTIPITYGRVVLTNSSLVSISEISTSFMVNPMSVEVTLHNRTGNKIILVHDYISASEAILLPYEKDLTIPNEGSVTLVKSSQAGGKFIIKGGAGGGQGSLNPNQLTLLTADDSLTEWYSTSSFEISKVTPIHGDSSYRLGITVDEAAITKVKPVYDSFKSRTLVFKFDYRLTSGTIKAVIFDQADTKLYGAEFTVPPAVGVGNFVTTFFMPPTVTGYRIGFVSESTVAGQTFQFDNVEITSEVSKSVNISNLPVGSIIASMLTEEQFLSAYGAGWIIADGRNVSGSKYSSVTGNATVPDLRGVFLRGRNNGRADGNQNPNGEVALGTFTGDAIRNITGNVTGFAVSRGYGGNTSGALSSSIISGYNTADSSSGGRNLSIDASLVVPTALDNRPKNVTVNHFIKIDDFNNSIVAPVDQVTERSIPWKWKSTALTASDPVGTYNTYTYTGGTNNTAIATTRPTQTDADMSLNGPLIYVGNYASTGTAAQPMRIDIKIAEPNQLSACDITLYKASNRQVSGSMDYVYYDSNNARGLTVKTFNPATGILTIDGRNSPTAVTTRTLAFDDNSVQNFGYICFTASKLAQGVAIPTPARYVVKPYQSGATWYEVYNDGWVRQNYSSTTGNTSTGSVVSFLVKMKDNNYGTLISRQDRPVTSITAADRSVIVINLTVNSVNVAGTANATLSDQPFNITVEGYGDSATVKSHGATPNY